MAKTAKKKTATARSARKSTGTKKSARKPNAAFMRPVTPSPALSEVIGSKPVPRTEVTKKLWAYIKKNKLQDAKNRRSIRADEHLRAVFGKATVRGSEIDNFGVGLEALAQVYKKL